MNYKHKKYIKSKNKVDFNKGAVEILDFTKQPPFSPPKEGKKVQLTIYYNNAIPVSYIIMEKDFDKAIILLHFKKIDNTLYKRTTKTGVDYLRRV